MSFLTQPGAGRARKTASDPITRLLDGEPISPRIAQQE
jgi:hypothetical protein